MRRPVTIMSAVMRAAEIPTSFYEDGVVLVTATVYGRNTPGLVTNLVDRERVSKPGTVNPPGCVLYGDGLQKRDFVHADDLARAVAEAPFWEPGFYEVATGRRDTPFGVFRLLTYEWGYTPKLVYEEAPDDELQDWPELKCALPWEPITLEEGLKKVVREAR